MLIISVLIYLLIALLLCLRIFKRISFSRAIILTCLTTVTVNILIVQGLSLLESLNDRWLFLFTQIIACAIIALVAWDPKHKIFRDPLPKPAFEFHTLRGWDIFLVLLASGILLLSLYNGALAPINNSDSLHTHLPRIYYWIQHGSLASWDAVTVTQLTYPVNVSIQGVWLFLLGGTERLFYLMPWLALLTATVLVYEVALLLNASKRGALFAALVGLSFPVVLLQTFSYQGDVFVAALCLAAVWFLLLFMRQRQSAFIFLSLVPLAAALGSKQTAFLFLPFYLLVVFVLWLKKSISSRVVYTAAAVFVACFALLAAYKFIQNSVERDKLESSMFASYRYSLPFSQPGDGRRYVTNSSRYFFQSISLDGLTGRAKLSALQAREGVFRALSRGIRIDLETREYISEGDEEYFILSENPPLNEDAAWFGPLSVFLFPAVVIVVLAGKDRARKRYLWISLAFILIVFLMIAVLITGWSPTNGRYLIIPVLLFTPLFAVLIPSQRFWSGLLTIVLSISAFLMAVSTLLINDARPLVTQQTLYTFQAKTLEKWDDSGSIGAVYAKYIANRVVESLLLTSPNRKDIRQQSYYENLFHQNTSAIANIEFVNTNMPDDAPLYIFMRKNIIEYALFGVDKTRRLTPFSLLEQAPSGSWVLVDKGRPQPWADGLNLIAENDSFWILLKP